MGLNHAGQLSQPFTMRAGAVIDELTERGVVEARRVDEDPYVGLAPRRPEEGLFAEDDLDRLFGTLAQLSPVGTGNEGATRLPRWW